MGENSPKIVEENSSDLATRLRRLIPMIMAGIGVIFIISGILINHFKNNQNTTVASLSNDKIGSVAGELVVKKVIVDISGAVEQPGIYSIPYDSRIANVLITAGGLSPKADRKYISRYINLAQRVSDSMKIYIPFEGDNFINQNGQGVGGVVSASALININIASASELDSLPGIGMATANKIIAGRPYQNTSDMTTRGIISKATFDKIKDRISVN